MFCNSLAFISLLSCHTVFLMINPLYIIVLSVPASHLYHLTGVHHSVTLLQPYKIHTLWQG